MQASVGTFATHDESVTQGGLTQVGFHYINPYGIFMSSPGQTDPEPEESSSEIEKDRQKAYGQVIAPGIIKKLNGNFRLDILAKGKLKMKNKGQGNKKIQGNQNNNASKPDFLSKGQMSSVGLQQKKSKGKGTVKVKGQSSHAWSDQKLINLEPIVPDLELLRKFGLTIDHALAFEQAYPSVLPLYPTYMTSDYGKRRAPKGKGTDFHYGVDLKADYQDVWATGSGVVTYAGYLNSYGYLVVVDHGYGITTKYAHNSKILVEKGQTVERYHVIAISGNTGNSTGPHLHYEIEFDGVSQNPMDIIYNR